MPRYLLKIDDKVSGPFSETALAEMASVRAFDETALAAPELTEDWRPVSAFPELHAQCFPPRKGLQLKAKAFESIETPNAEPVSVDQILQENLAAEARAPRPKLRRLPNRRRRDFLVSLLLIDGVLGALWHWLPRTQETDVAFGSAAALLTLGIYWLFYHIMDRY